jgi:hypothetical protein
MPTMETERTTKLVPGKDEDGDDAVGASMYGTGTGQDVACVGSGAAVAVAMAMVMAVAEEGDGDGRWQAGTFIIIRCY